MGSTFYKPLSIDHRDHRALMPLNPVEIDF
jgi:hypothetical protein